VTADQGWSWTSFFSSIFEWGDDRMNADGGEMSFGISFWVSDVRDGNNTVSGYRAKKEFAMDYDDFSAIFIALGQMNKPRSLTNESKAERNARLTHERETGRSGRKSILRLAEELSRNPSNAATDGELRNKPESSEVPKDIVIDTLPGENYFFNEEGELQPSEEYIRRRDPETGEFKIERIK